MCTGYLKTAEVNIVWTCLKLQRRRRNWSNAAIGGGWCFIVIGDWKIRPTGIDRDEPLQNTVGNHKHLREESLVPVLCILYQPLHGNEIITGDDGFVVVLQTVLVAVLVIFLWFMIQIIRCPRLACKHIPTMPLILKDLQHGARRPLHVSLLCSKAILGQGVGNILAGVSIQVHEEYEPDGSRLVLINHKVAVFILIVSKEWRGKENTPLESHLDRSVHYFTFRMALFLGEGGDKGEAHFAVGVQRVYVFGLKEHAYWWIHCL